MKNMGKSRKQVLHTRKEHEAEKQRHKVYTERVVGRLKQGGIWKHWVCMHMCANLNSETI